MKRAVFAAIYCVCPIYKDYDDPSMSDEEKNKNHPLILMMNRWDNKLGFPGGFVNEGENFSDALIREVIEETFIGLHDIDEENIFYYHKFNNTQIYVYPIYMGLLGVDRIKKITASSVNATHFLSEGTICWKSLRRNQRSALLEANNLMPGVKQDLKNIISMWCHDRAN